MKLVLFHTRQGKGCPILQAPPSVPCRRNRESGRWNRIKGRIWEAYERLVEKIDYHQEALWSHLRRTSNLEIYHTLHLTAQQAEKMF